MKDDGSSGLPLSSCSLSHTHTQSLFWEEINDPWAVHCSFTLVQKALVITLVSYKTNI